MDDVRSTNARCCPKKCIRLFEQDSLARMRYNFWIRPFPNRVEWFYDKAMGRTLGSNVEWPTDYGFKVCSKAFCSAYGINKSFFYKYMAKFKDGAISAGCSRTQLPSSTYSKAMDWLQEYPRSYGDRMPHTEDILLPYKTRKQNVWKKYSEEMAEEMEPQLCRSTFQTMWKKHFVHLKIKKVTNTLAISFLGVLLVTNPPIRLMCPTSVCPSVNIFIYGL